MSKLDIGLFTEVNRKRCEESFHPIDAWSAPEWGCALAGEVGELCNYLKKIHRGDFTTAEAREACKKEIGDIFAYLNLISLKLDIDMEDAVIDKFNEVSDRVGSSIKYEPLNNSNELDWYHNYQKMMKSRFGE